MINICAAPDNLRAYLAAAIRFWYLVCLSSKDGTTVQSEASYGDTSTYASGLSNRNLARFVLQSHAQIECPHALEEV